MVPPRSKTASLGLLLMILFASGAPTAHARRIIPVVPQPDWTIKIGGGTFGVQGIRGQTMLHVGNARTLVPISFASFVGISATIASCTLVAAVVAAFRRRDATPPTP